MIRHGRRDQEAFRSAHEGAGLSDIVSFNAWLWQSLPSFSTISTGCDSVCHSRLSEHYLFWSSFMNSHFTELHILCVDLCWNLCMRVHVLCPEPPPQPRQGERLCLVHLHTHIYLWRYLFVYLLHVTWPQWPPLWSLTLKRFFFFFPPGWDNWILIVWKEIAYIFSWLSVAKVWDLVSFTLLFVLLISL